MSRFGAARRRAFVQDLLASLFGKPVDLLSFDEVRRRLRLRRLEDRGLQVVPLDRIAGSLGRSQEFTRAFLPRREATRERWRRVEQLAEGLEGFEPVELYLVGGTYFVVDGHHRISVVRALGGPSIEAWVKELPTVAKVEPGDSAADLVLEQERIDFLAASGLEAAGPDDLRVTLANGYERLLEHVSTHRYFLGLERGQPVAMREASRSWRRRVYEPALGAIRRHRVIEQFPGRSETDLYLFVMEHLARLREEYGLELDAEDAAGDLSEAAPPPIDPQGDG